MNLLLLHSSLNGTDSLSSALAREFVTDWRREYPGGRVVERDLALDPVPHLTASAFEAFASGPAGLDADARDSVELSDALIDELAVTDVVVLAVPMYNFGVPSTLKAWFDHVARAGRTFRYTADGPIGLLSGKRAVVLATRGGRYAGTPHDTQTAFLRNLLAFLGIDDVDFVHVEGTALGNDERRAAVKAARQRIGELVLANAA